MRKVISNTSCLIVLDNIGLFYVLRELYGNILVTEEVSHEFGKELEDWVLNQKIRDEKYFKVINTFIDKGEASAIVLALETDNSILIIDDLKGRKIAKNLGLSITGTLGVILKAKQQGLISSLKEVLDAFKDQGFRISSGLEREILKYD